MKRKKIFKGLFKSNKRLIKNRDYYYSKNEEQLSRAKAELQYEILRAITR